MKLGRNTYCKQLPQITGAFNYGLVSKDKHFVDLMCGTGCTGWGPNSRVKNRIFERMLSEGIPTNTYDYTTTYRIKAEEALSSLFPGYDFGFFSGGAEAVEAAIRVAKDIAENVHKKKGKIAAFTNCFHGKTYLAGLLTEGKNTEATTILPYNDISVNIPDDISIIILESVQTRNGVQVASKEFLKKITNHCTKNGVVLIVDEISSGYRCGEKTAISTILPSYEPDIITLGKNYGQGIPVSILAVNNKYLDVVKTSLTSGYGGNPLACIAVEESVKEFIDRQEEIKTKGNLFWNMMYNKLSGCPGIDRMTHIGMWFSIGLNKAVDAAEIGEYLKKQGFLIGIVGNSIRLAPQFDLEDDMWELFLKLLESKLREKI